MPRPRLAVPRRVCCVTLGDSTYDALMKFVAAPDAVKLLRAVMSGAPKPDEFGMLPENYDHLRNSLRTDITDADDLLNRAYRTERSYIERVRKMNTQAVNPTVNVSRVVEALILRGMSPAPPLVAAIPSSSAATKKKTAYEVIAEAKKRKAKDNATVDAARGPRRDARKAS